MPAADLRVSIIQRAGIIPLSIAGIFKEVTTISISAVVFGDQLTEVNIIGVAIAITGESAKATIVPGLDLMTFAGIALYTYHKYQKSILTPLPLDAHGRPVSPSSLAPSGQAHGYTSIRDRDSAVPLAPLDSRTASPTYPPGPARETPEDRTQRLRDEFEGWGRDENWSDEDDDEVGEEEVQRRMTEREGSKSVTVGTGASARKGRWGEWWEKEM